MVRSTLDFHLGPTYNTHLSFKKLRTLKPSLGVNVRALLILLPLIFGINARADTSYSTFDDYAIGEKIAIALTDLSCVANLVEFKMDRGRRVEARLDGCADLIGKYEYNWHPSDHSLWNGQPSYWVDIPPLHTNGCETGGFCVGDHIVMFNFTYNWSITKGVDYEIKAMANRSVSVDFLGKLADGSTWGDYFFISPYEREVTYFGKGSGCRILNGNKMCVGDEIRVSRRCSHHYDFTKAKVLALTDARMGPYYHPDTVIVSHRCFDGLSPTCFNLADGDSTLLFPGGRCEE